MENIDTLGYNNEDLNRKIFGWDLRKMFTNIQIDENELNAKLQKRLFWNLVLTGCIANMVGFLSNVILFGMTLPTIVCGVCVMMMVLCGVAGIRFGKQRTAAAVMVLILSLIEFPFLFYVYGANMGVYFVLGIVALAIFFPRPYHIAAIVITILIDIAVIIFSSLYHTLEVMNRESQLGTMLCSYVIVAVSVASMLCNLISEYMLQRAHLLKASRDLQYAANRDALTGVYNRGYLIQTLKQWMGTEDKRFLVALIDVDNFKSINDTYGHVYGDEVLIELARLMKQEIRGKGIAARYGGEEFMLLFEEPNQQKALDVLERIKIELGAFSMKTRQIIITFSGGLEEYRTEGKIDELFRRADKKLYQAKNGGKNHIVC